MSDLFQKNEIVKEYEYNGNLQEEGLIGSSPLSYATIDIYVLRQFSYWENYNKKLGKLVGDE